MTAAKKPRRVRLTPGDLDLTPREVVSIPLGVDSVTQDPIKRYYYLGCNEIATLEELIGSSLLLALVTPKERTRMGFMRDVLWVGFQPFEPELTREEVGRLLSRNLNQTEDIWSHIYDAMVAGMPGMKSIIDKLRGADKSVEDEEATEDPDAPLSESPSPAEAPTTSS